MFLEYVWALKLLKATHIKIGWVSCRVRRKMKINECYRCLGFDHMVANYRRTDRSRSCWRYGEEGHGAGSCTRKSQFYVCFAKKDRPRDDHIRDILREAAYEAKQAVNGDSGAQRIALIEHDKKNVKKYLSHCDYDSAIKFELGDEGQCIRRPFTKPDLLGRIISDKVNIVKMRPCVSVLLNSL